MNPKQLIDQFESPLYVYDEQILRRQCETMRKNFKKFFPEGRILYACKANTNLHLLKIIREYLDGIDAVSTEEIQVALMAGFNPDSIVFTANYVSPKEIEFALKNKILINVGELDNLRRVRDLGEQTMVRLNLDIGVGHHQKVTCGGSQSKFGVHYQTWVDELLKYNNIIGLHQHIGSKIMKKDAEKYLKSVSELFQVAKELISKGLQIKYVDIGGGFGVKYKDDEEVNDLEELFEKIREIYDENFKDYKPQLFIEPGRYIVAECGSLLAEVTAINNNGVNTFVGTNTGMNHLIRPALYESYHKITNSQEKQQVQEVIVCGNICESGDILGYERRINAALDDILIIHTAGAYGYAMASNYNVRGRPAEILIGDNHPPKLIRRRETIADLMSTTPE